MEIANSEGNGENRKWQEWKRKEVEDFSLVIEGSNSGKINEENLGILLDSNEERKRRHGPSGNKSHTNDMELDNLMIEKEGNQVAIVVGD